MDAKFTVADVANASSLSDGREAAASDNLSALASRPVSRVRLGFSFAQAADVSGFTAGTSFDEVASESKVSSGSADATQHAKPIDLTPACGYDAFVARFWKHVDIRGPRECWLWTGGVQSRGYGSVGFKCADGKMRTFQAHRIAYALVTGQPLLGPEILIMHKCDERRCQNVRHMVAGSNYDNIQDAITKGRMGRDARGRWVPLAQAVSA